MKRINRSMVCREVSSLAKRIERGGVCNGHDSSGISTAGAIQGKYITIEISEVEYSILVFDTEQECIDALRSLTEAVLDEQFPILVLKTEGISHLVYPEAVYSQVMEQVPDISGTIPGTNIPLSLVTRIAIMDDRTVPFYIRCECIVLSQLSYNVNNGTYPIVMTKEYVTTNYPTAELNDFTIRFI